MIVDRVPDVEVAGDEIAVTRIAGWVCCDQFGVCVIGAENGDTGAGRTLGALNSLRALGTDLVVHDLHDVHKQRWCIYGDTIGDRMLDHNVNIRDPIHQLQVIVSSQSEQKIPGGNLILVLRDHQFRRRIGDRCPILRQPDIDLKSVPATATMMQLRRELQIISTVIGERDPRAGHDTDAVRFSRVVQRHRCRSIDRCGLLILIRKKRPIITESPGSTRSNNRYFIADLLDNNRIRDLINNNLIDCLINNHVIVAVVHIGHLVTSGVTLKVPCNNRVTTPFEATISKSYT